MSAKTKSIALLFLLLSLFSTSCLMQEKVTVNGQVMEEGYVVKRPIADALNNSQ
jgi:outer membrane protein assembly factor BamE (lipoprotein component of BamABCDE complex)